MRAGGTRTERILDGAQLSAKRLYSSHYSAMKLLLYSHFFGPSVGGVETIVRLLARGLVEVRTPGGAREFELTLVTETPQGEFDDTSLGFRLLRRPSHPQLAREIAAARVVHLAGPALRPLWMALRKHKPVVVEHHGFHTICPNGQLLIDPPGAPCPGHFRQGHHAACWRCNAQEGRLASLKVWVLTFVRRWLCRQVSANVTPTRWLGEQLGLPNTVTIHHGLAEQKNDLVKIATDRPVLACVGRLVTTKGVRLLLDATCLLAAQKLAFELVIIGDGPERPALELAAAKCNVNGPAKVRFAGRLSGEEVAAELARASAVVVPSLGGEVFGLSVAENMQRGLPVIASDIGALSEVLGDAGWLFQTGDTQQLASAMAQVLRDPAQARIAGMRGEKRIAEQFSSAKMVAEHADLYRRLAPDSRAPVDMVMGPAESSKEQ